MTPLRACIAAACILLAGCGSSGGKAKTTPRVLASGVRLSAADFKLGGPIPRADTCDGGGRKPSIRITGAPSSAKALVLFMHDPDAPGRDFTHWTVYEIPPAAHSPSGVEGRNDLGKTGYTPPCPPPGAGAHHYVFDLYALRSKTGLPPGASPVQVRAAIARLAFAHGSLVGTYSRR